jgi:protein-disulfide isomerase
MVPTLELRTPVSKADHFQGTERAPLTLVEYGDFQCSDCGEAFPVVKRIQQALGRQLRFVFREFPLSQAHPDSMNAAKMAEAAALQGKFWEMHGLLFENQNDLDLGSLAEYAKKLGLSAEKISDALDGKAVEKKISTDFEGGVRTGVVGTPAFFVNGLFYDGDRGDGPFLTGLEGLLKEQNEDDGTGGWSKSAWKSSEDESGGSGQAGDGTESEI